MRPVLASCGKVVYNRDTLKGKQAVKIRGRWELIVKLNPTTVAIPNICFPHRRLPTQVRPEVFLCRSPGGAVVTAEAARLRIPGGASPTTCQETTICRRLYQHQTFEQLRHIIEQLSGRIEAAERHKDFRSAQRLIANRNRARRLLSAMQRMRREVRL